MPRKPIIFVSTMEGDPWGGSEELWSRAAIDLARQGFTVSANVPEWEPVHPRVSALMRGGVDVRFRPRSGHYRFRRHPLKRILYRDRRPLLVEIEQQIASRSPALIVISDGTALAPVDLLELCTERQIPFVSLGQANGDNFWYGDQIAARYRAVLPRAVACYFVSEANLLLAEKQIGDAIPNAEVVRNPVNVSRNVFLPWLAADESRFASVGRLHPPSKGQDILLEALAAPEWRARDWRLSVYGEGPMREVLERLAQRLGISRRVAFAGFASVENIWAENHVLVMPSRYEGLPLAMVEAMLCGRPVVATDVAGHREIMRDGVTGFLAKAPTVACFRSALERFWERRHEAEAIGRAAAQHISSLLPDDPVREFSDKLRRVYELA